MFFFLWFNSCHFIITSLAASSLAPDILQYFYSAKIMPGTCLIWVYISTLLMKMAQPAKFCFRTKKTKCEEVFHVWSLKYSYRRFDENTYSKSVFGSMVAVAFQIAFRAEIHVNDVFLKLFLTSTHQNDLKNINRT